MKPPRVTGLALPRHWTPEQALAAFELAEILHSEIWRLYRADIQRALREQDSAKEKRQRHLPLDGEPPF